MIRSTIEDSRSKCGPLYWALLLFVVVTACGEREKSTGTYDLTAEGGLQVAMHGIAEASYEPLFSGREFIVSLNVGGGTPPWAGFSYLAVFSASRPGTGAVYSSGRGVGDTTNGRKRARIALGGASGVASPWLSDSGIAEFTASDRHGLAGTVVLFLRCRTCSTINGPSNAVVRASFATRD